MLKNVLTCIVLVHFAVCKVFAVLPDPNDGWISPSLISVTASGSVTGMGPEKTIDGSGLASDLTHSINSTDLWTCSIDDGRWGEGAHPPYNANYSPSGLQGDGWIQYTFSTPQTIGEMWVWNYNDRIYTTRGYRYVAVDYSTDGINFARLGGANYYFTFAPATGNSIYTYNNKINFGGISGVQKVVLTARYSDGIYGDPSYGGLSEVQFRKPVENMDGWVDASMINITTSGFTIGMGPERTVDASGLSSALTHSTTSSDVWTCSIDDGRWGSGPHPPYNANYSPSGLQGDGWIQYTFNTAQPISKMWVWNYNASGNTDRGYRYVAIDYSVDGTTWTRLGGSNYYFTFAQAPGTADYTCNNQINFGGLNVKKVVLTAHFSDGIYGDPSYGGLSEVRFEKTTAAVPTPSHGSITPTNAILYWTPGDFAVYHDVYFGLDKNSVTNASRTDSMGVLVRQGQADAFYDTGGLQAGTTYYWRVDEVSSGGTIWRGAVWCFRTITSEMAASPLAIVVPSSQSTNSAVTAENIIDNNPATFWVSDYDTFPNWMELRWPQPINSSRVTVNEVAGYLSASYRIDVFRTDTNTWQTVVGPKTNPNPGNIIDESFTPTEISKLRFYALSGYAGATQSGISGLQVYGSGTWSDACKSSLPPYLSTVTSYPPTSAASFTCTSFSANPAAVAPGSKVLITLQLRKAVVDSANYGFQVRIGDLSLSTSPVYPGDYTVAVSAIKPSRPTSQWVIGQDYTVSASIYIPKWAPHGNTSVIVTPLSAASRGTITNVTNNIVGTVKLQKFAVDPSPWPATVPTSNITIANDQANLYINGTLVQPYIMTTPDDTTYQSIGEQMISNGHLWRVLTIKCVDANYSTPAGDAENAACFADLDQKINSILKFDPNAYILPTLLVRASDAWTARFPDDATVLSNGTRIQYSLSSTRWKNQLDYDYRALVSHLMTQSYSGHVIGVHFEMAKETQYWGCWENPAGTTRTNIAFGDYSAAHLSAFRSWLRIKYGDNQNDLRIAWNDPTVTFDTAYPTPSILRQQDSTLMFKDPGITRMPMDYWQFHAGEMANMAIVPAKAVKEASNNKYITGLWGFYIDGVYAASDSPGQLVQMGHTALQTVLASPYIDYLMILNNYENRRWGTTPVIPYTMMESILKHGKMPLVEHDMRTFFTPLDFHDRTYSEPETLSVLYANAWGSALRGQGLWWVGFSAGATNSTRTSIPWFASESVNAALVNSKKWYDSIRATPSPSIAQIAVFINSADAGAMDAFDGYQPQVSAPFNAIMYELPKLGAPIDYYEIDDITLPCMSQYKVYIFLSAYSLTTAQRNTIKTVVRQSGKTAVWLYGAGYNITGSSNSTAWIQDITGMATNVTFENRRPTVNFVSDPNLPANYTLQPQPWINDPNPSAYTIGPIFDVENDTSRTILGRYAHNNRVSCASKIVGNGKSVYIGIPYVSSTLLRKICKDAGVFLYYPSGNLILDADQHFILITNGSAAFNGNISLPQSSQVYDLWNNTILGTGTSFMASIPANTSRMYFYGTSDEVSNFRGQATNLAPPNGATNIALNPTLSWTAGTGAVTHNVNFGTTNPPSFVQNQSGTTYTPGTLLGNNTYFWRIDEVGNYGVTTGTVSSFTTLGNTPTFVAAGNGAAGIGAITPALPSSIAANDILLLFLETANQSISIANQNGGTWTQVTNSPQGTGTAGSNSATRITVFWSRYNGTQGAPTTSDSGDHQLGRIIAIRGAVATGNLWDITAGGVEAVSDTSGSIPGATTTVNNALIVAAIATALPDADGSANFSTWTNSSLTNLTERTDNIVSDGNGGGLAIVTGVKSGSGAYGNTAVTTGLSTYKSMLSIAIKP